MENHAIIGIAGHVDHGKTSLVKSLTGVDTDRKMEEKLRGVSIEAGVAPLKLPSGMQVAVMDVPGHTDFLKNTIRGLNHVDIGILVVAADDGVMPQTLEHLEILKFFNTCEGFVVLSKIDLVDEETRELAELEINELVKGTFLEDKPIYQFSTKARELSDPIITGIDRMVKVLPAKSRDRPFRLWIDQVRSLPGHGTVVSGTITSGVIQCNEAIELLPTGARTRARSLQSHALVINQAFAGQRVGINLHRISLAHVSRGMCLTTPGALSASQMLNASLRVLEGARIGIKNRQKVKIYLGTAMVTGMVAFMGRECVRPGESDIVQLRLMQPVAASPGDPVVITPMNLNTIIAGGRILETTTEKCRKIKVPTIRPALEALSRQDIDAYLEHVFDSGRNRLATAKQLAVKTGLSTASFERRINSEVRKGNLIYFKGKGAVRATHLERLKHGFRNIVDAAFKIDPLKNNISLQEVAERMPEEVQSDLLESVAELLCAKDQLKLHQGGFRPPEDKTVLDKHRQALINKLLAYAKDSAMVPFSADTFWKRYRDSCRKDDVSQLLNYLHARHQLVRLKDMRFLSLEAIEEIKARVARAIADKGFVTVADCKQLFGYGRWGGTHVLDYLNSTGFTVRRDDRHYLKDDDTR